MKHSFFNKKQPSSPLQTFHEKEFDLEILLFEYESLSLLFRINPQNSFFEKYALNDLRLLTSLLICYYQQDYVRQDLKRLYAQAEELTKIGPAHTEIIYDRDALHDSCFLDGIVQLRKLLDEVSIKRSHFSYSRALVTFMLEHLQRSKYSDMIKELNRMFGTSSRYIEGINFLNKSREFTGILGVLLFSIRFIINIVLLLKHWFKALTNPYLSASKVLNQELKKRGFLLLNDFAWATMSILSIFHQQLHLSTLALSPLLATFLIFDIASLLVQWYADFSRNKKIMKNLQQQIGFATAEEKIIIEQQINILQDQWHAENSYYIINIIASKIIALSLIFSFFCTTSIVLATLALCSTIASALYNTAKDYKKFRRSELALHAIERNLTQNATRAQLNLRDELQEETQLLQGQFWKKLALNTCGMAFILAASIACWPVAIAVTALYLGYQAYQSHQHSKHSFKLNQLPIYTLPEELLPAAAMGCN
ncbi:MAG: hypothetical protein J0I93_07815 [Legionella sp.]|nr:hypothetical protein [Legionella sp.]